MIKLPIVIVLLASLTVSACATGVKSPVVRFDRQVDYGNGKTPTQQPSAVDFRLEINAQTQ